MERTYVQVLRSRMREERRFMQVVAGPRQVGKTTIVHQVLDSLDIPYIYAAADTQQGNHDWIARQWDRARLLARAGNPMILAFDELQKIEGWSEVVKKYWDEDSFQKRDIRVIISGSSRLLLEKGLSESLLGRFELIHVPHWSYEEMREVFGLSLDEFVYFGGYPGSMALRRDEGRWKSYLVSSIIDASIASDILGLEEVRKPALLRQLFLLGAHYSAQILSYTKMLGQLQDAGNTTTLAGYMQLLDESCLLAGLQKYSGSMVCSRSSSPKLQVFDNALFSALDSLSFADARNNPDVWGRYVESAVGCRLLASGLPGHHEVEYWRDGNNEIDFIFRHNDQVCGIEVKSGLQITGKSMRAFRKAYPDVPVYVVGESEGIPLEEFLLMDPYQLFR